MSKKIKLLKSISKDNQCWCLKFRKWYVKEQWMAQNKTSTFSTLSAFPLNFSSPECPVLDCFSLSLKPSEATLDSPLLISTSPLFPSMEACLDAPSENPKRFWWLDGRIYTKILGRFLPSQQNDRFSQLLPYFAPRSLHPNLQDGKIYSGAYIRILVYGNKVAFHKKESLNDQKSRSHI